VTPEEIELAKKRRVLDRLADRLASAEELMADLHAEQERFEARYTMSVGRLYAAFDDIEAQIAEEEHKLVPDDEQIKERAEELRRRAEESAAKTAAAEGSEEFKPTAEAKKAYHELARAIHPDLALDSAEKDKRHGLMAELNLAYSSGDQQKLNRLVEDMRNSPDLVAGDGIGDELVRLIRQIAQANHRLKQLATEKATAEATELFTLRQKVEKEAAAGRDLLSQMGASTAAHIKKAQRRLTNLRMVNEAQEKYVKEEFGLDIEEFRRP
jgi:hypothetical protein